MNYYRCQKLQHTLLIHQLSISIYFKFELFQLAGRVFNLSIFKLSKCYFNIPKSTSLANSDVSTFVPFLLPMLLYSQRYLNKLLFCFCYDYQILDDNSFYVQMSFFYELNCYFTFYALVYFYYFDLYSCVLK